MSKPVEQPPKTVRRPPSGQRAVNFVTSAYTTAGWQIQMSPKGAITTFIASSGKKWHHVRVVLAEQPLVEGDKINFNQNAIANKASPIIATYSETAAKDGAITPSVKLFDVNENKAVRLVAPRAKA